MARIECEVLYNCRNQWACWQCVDYNLYSPVDRRIKSPRQLRKAQERKAHKKSDKAKQGRANRNAGKRAERTLENTLTANGITCRRVPLSGALKATNLVGALEDRLAGDMVITINGKEYRAEVKRRADLKTLYRRIDESPGGVEIEGFCILMGQDAFFQLSNLGAKPATGELVEDKGFKKLHGWFEQDNCQIVAMKEAYKEWLFAVDLKTIKELTK